MYQSVFFIEKQQLLICFPDIKNGNDWYCIHMLCNGLFTNLAGITKDWKIYSASHDALTVIYSVCQIKLLISGLSADRFILQTGKQATKIELFYNHASYSRYLFNTC